MVSFFFLSGKNFSRHARLKARNRRDRNTMYPERQIIIKTYNLIIRFEEMIPSIFKRFPD